MSYRFKSASWEFLKEAVSQEWIDARLARAQAQGASANRMAEFAQRRGQAVDRHLAASNAPNTPRPEQIRQLRLADRSAGAEAHGMANVMGQQVSPTNANTARLNAASAARHQVTPPSTPAATPASAPRGVASYLPKSNWGRAGLAVGAAGLAYGGYRMLNQQPQQPLYR